MAELDVHKESVKSMFGGDDMQGRGLIIPEYQREYKWNTELCETLWDDIVRFAENRREGEEYFLGSFVTCSRPKEKNLEIIDGQQRTTSLLLLLRAFYAMLESTDESDEVKGLMGQIAPCIWDVDPVTRLVTNTEKIHIESKVITDERRDVFHKILQTGKCGEKDKSNYAANYQFFQEKCREYAADNPIADKWHTLVITILKGCVILHIGSDNSDTALRIFTTLNDRGLPLEDADKFKAQLYKNCNLEERSKFIDQWKALNKICEDGNIKGSDERNRPISGINALFRYYMYVLQAETYVKTRKEVWKENDTNLLEFYAGEHGDYKRLDDAVSIMDKLRLLADFWKSVNTGKDDSENEIPELGVEIRKYFHILIKGYTNGTWRAVISVFFLKDYNLDADNFKQKLSVLLKRLTAYLFYKGLADETVSFNSVRQEMCRAYCVIQNGEEWIPNIQGIEKTEMREKLASKKVAKLGSSKVQRGLLLLLAYQYPDQEKVLQDEKGGEFEIEHIYPQNPESEIGYQGWTKEVEEELTETLGNKVMLEKELNIKVSNGYFSTKKKQWESRAKKKKADLRVGYGDSESASARDICKKYRGEDWTPDNVKSRQDEIAKTLLNFFTEQLPTLK
ncbi:MAG: DUF262 domain-containing HNH endonuclease family protein [Planctomycetaceae bacterium]|jgi:uncharacterized protein with ParB-like and HNH nuclease domain|nr:DUF262 domain-containing HNH endonuclease family protein [Planctomycetaceae bacterium]